jgi:hypothetical protein
MAKTTVFGADLAASAQAEALAHKHAQIDQMVELAEKQACFRQLIISHFEDAKHARRDFSTWLFEWIFADRTKTVRAGPCCDFCHSKRITNRSHLQFVEEVMARA